MKSDHRHSERASIKNFDAMFELSFKLDYENFIITWINY